MTAPNAPLGASTDAALIRINQTVPRLRQLAYPEVVHAAEFKCLFERLGDPPCKRSMTFIERVTAVPAPPRGHGRHRYHFRLLALSVDHLSLGAGPSCSEVEREARRHAIAEAILVGVYQR